MRRRLDDPRLLSPDSLLNMFLSYLRIEVCAILFLKFVVIIIGLKINKDSQKFALL